jgi:hypothetical protein
MTAPHPIPNDQINVRSHNVWGLAELTTDASVAGCSDGCIPHAASGQTTVNVIASKAHMTQKHLTIMDGHSWHALLASND